VAPASAGDVAVAGSIEGSVLSQQGGAPVNGARVTLLEMNVQVETGTDGRFSFLAPPGTYTLHIECEGFGLEERSVVLASGEKAALDVLLATDTNVAEVVINVGSRTPRSRTETPLPVDVITSDAIRRVGASETGRILSTLAPSFVSVPQTIADGSDHVDPASLRGLGPDQVLVLINGKRRHPSALLHLNGTFGRGTVGTDLNAIPSASIRRIEVLRDGAALQYGSDAIAGVINIVTKNSTDYLDVNSRAGVTGEGDGERLEASANYGIPIGERGGFVNFTTQFLERAATNRSGTYNGPIYTDDAAADDATLAANGLTRNDLKMKIGESAATVAMVGYNMEIPVGDHATFYSFGDLSHRYGRAAGFYRFPRQTAQTVPEYYPNGFLPEIATTIDDRAVTLGVRAQQAGWNIDLSLTHGQNVFQFNVENSVNASLGTGSPTTFDAGSLHFSQTVGDIDLRRPLAVGLKQLSFVLGSEFRVENYAIGAGDEASWVNGGATYGDPPQPKIPGAQVFPGFQPSNEVDRFRNNVGVYTGFESELLDGLNLDIGGRYEHYSDFGSAVMGKAATRAEILPGIALRGAASNGFRAPSLQQEWFSNVSTLFLPDPVSGNLEPAQVLTSNNESPVTRQFGIAPLKQEKSLNLSGGVVLHPLSNLLLTADAYFVRIKDRIVLTSQFPNSNPAVASLLAPFPSVGQAQFFANAVNTDTIGLDLVADYTLHLDPGTLTLTASANFTKTEVKDINIPASLVGAFAGADPAALQTYYFGRAARNRLEDAVPRRKATASATFVQGPFSALVRANHYGKVAYKPDLADNDESFRAKTLFDADVGYEITPSLRLGVGAENIFNVFPDRNTKAANLSNGRFLYNRNVSQFGWNGGFYYARLRLMLF
jgi:iron complex outermembrane recepter protein